MNGHADLVVLGAGPAGAAAAIWGAGLGLKVALIERSAFPRFRPGETLHPGVQTVLRQLGVAGRVEGASRIRPEGQIVGWGVAPRYVPYGRDERGAWMALQIARRALDAILLARARNLGVRVLQPARANPVVRSGRIDHIQTDAGDFTAAFVVDATGASGSLRRELRLGFDRRSPPLTAFYGYARRTDGGAPRLDGDAQGWTWTAQVDASIVHWCRLSFRGERSRLAAPKLLHGCEPIGAIRAADVTWRLAVPTAGPGYFLTGDAAFVLDPAASHGVLRALMSGMKAAQTAFDVLAGRVDAAGAAACYHEWISAWFEHDVARLAHLYAELDPDWPASADLKPARARSRPTRGAVIQPKLKEETRCPRR